MGKESSCVIDAQEFIMRTIGLRPREVGLIVDELAKALWNDDKVGFEELRQQHSFIGRAYWRGTQKRPTVVPSVRLAIFQRDGWRCRHCGSQGRLELDHVIPYSKGGAHAAENFQTLCHSCNRKKGTNDERCARAAQESRRQPESQLTDESGVSRVDAVFDVG